VQNGVQGTRDGGRTIEEWDDTSESGYHVVINAKGFHEARIAANGESILDIFLLQLSIKK
jgi:hypothetical protein